MTTKKRKIDFTYYTPTCNLRFENSILMQLWTSCIRGEFDTWRKVDQLTTKKRGEKGIKRRAAEEKRKFLATAK